MAKFHQTVVRFKNGKQSSARVVGNNAAWLCACGEVLLGPTLYKIDPCPGEGCGRQFEVVAAAKGVQPAVAEVREV